MSVDRRLLIVCAIPPLQVLLNHRWMLSIQAGIDPWIYFGYFNDFSGHLRAFDNTYYGSRLSWIVPGAIAYRLFTPIVANYVLHLLMCEVALVSLYLTLRSTTRRDVAFLVTMLTAGYPFFLRALGWDYVDGPGITYYLLSICLSTYAARSCRHRLGFALAGAAYAAAIHTNMIWLLFAPVVLAYGLLTIEARGWLARCALAFSFVAGGVALTLVLAAVNASVTGEWFFFAPSFRIAGGLTDRNPWKAADYTFIGRAPWLAAPLLLLVLTIWFLPRLARRTWALDRAPALFAAQYLIFVVGFIALEFAGLPLLETQFYASYLIPVMALALAGVLHAVERRGVAYDGPIVVAASIAMATVPYMVPVYRWAFSVMPEYGTVRSGILWPLACFAVAAIALVVRKTPSTIVFLAAVVAANMDMAVSESGIFTETPPITKEITFRAVVDALPIIRSCGPSADARFWYDATEPNGDVFRAAASTQLWAYRLVSETFPSLAQPASGPPLVPNVGDRLLIASGSTGRWKLAADALDPHGLEADRLWSRRVSQGPVDFEMTCMQVMAHHRAEAPIPVSAEHFAQLNGPAAAVRFGSAGRLIEIRTNRSQYDWQIVSDAIPVTPDADYSLEFNIKIRRGGMGVAIIGQKSALLGSKNWCSPRDGYTGIHFRSTGESRIRIALSNCGMRPRVSFFAVEDLRLWRVGGA